MHSRGSVVTRRSCWLHDLSRRDRVVIVEPVWLFDRDVRSSDRSYKRSMAVFKGCWGQHVREPGGLIYGYLGA